MHKTRRELERDSAARNAAALAAMREEDGLEEMATDLGLLKNGQVCNLESCNERYPWLKVSSSVAA
jgi:hypothetical protein